MSLSELQAAGFAPIRRSPRRMVCNIQSIRKSVGKTRLAFTAKKPLGYISVEIGSEEGVGDSFIPEGANENPDIQIIRVRMDQPVWPDASGFNMDDKKQARAYNDLVCASVQTVAVPAMDAFYDAYHASLKYLKSTVIDTGTDLVRLVKNYHFGRTEQIPQLAYTAVNNEFAKLFDDAFSYPGNLIMVNHMKDKGTKFTDDRGNEKWAPSGAFEVEGPKIITDKVQAVIEMWREDLPEDAPNQNTGRAVKFCAQIVDSRQNADIIGMKFEDDNITFADIGMSVFPGSSRSDWE